MTKPPSDHDDERWVEALHAAVVDDTDAVLPSYATPLVDDDLDAVHDCLLQLEQVRRSGSWRKSLPQPAAAANATAAGTRLGRFEIIRELGRGGHGVVLLAYDPALRREVALKVPRPEVLASPGLRRRFLREAHAAARLTHPGIVAVHEIGDAWPGCYLATDYCSGGSLQAYLAAGASRLQPRTAAAIVAELALAVQYAHEHGVLHRDIKPSNVLLAPRVDSENAAATDPLLVFKPKLADFGLARLAEGDAEETATGTLLGTLAYMAPEQAEGRLRDVGPKSDVFALGTLLYELLIGQPPFRGSSDADTLRQILFVEPTRPRRLRNEIPSDLEAICLRALEKDLKRRYSSAGLLADDLQRYLKGLPTLARPPAALARAVKWARRRPAMAALVAVCCLALLVGGGGLAVHNVTLRELTRQAQASDERSQELLYAADMTVAQQAYNNANVLHMEELLSRHLPGKWPSDRREFAWQFLDNLLNRHIDTLPRHPGDVYDLAFSPDDQTLATTCRDGRLRIFRLADRELLHDLENHRGEAGPIAYSPDGAMLATGGDDGRVVLRDAKTLAIVRVLSIVDLGEDPEQIGGFQFAPDGGRIYVASDRDILVWNVHSGQLLARQHHAHKYRIRMINLAPDGSKLLTIGRLAHIWQPETLDLVMTVDPPSPYWRSGRFLPDSQRIALADSRSSLYTCDHLGEDLSAVSRMSNVLPTGEVAFSADSQLMIAASDDGSVQVLTHPLATVVNSRQQFYRKHDGRVWDVKLSGDGTRFATAGQDGQVVLWQVPRNGFHLPEDGTIETWLARRPLQAVSYSPDGRFMACGVKDYVVAVVDRWTNRVLQLPANLWIDETLCFTNDSQKLIVSSSGNILQMWDLRSGEMLRTFTVPYTLKGFDLSPMSDRVALLHGDSQVTVHSWPDLQPIHQIVDPRSTYFAKFSPSGKELLIGRDGILTALDAGDFQVRWTAGRSGEVFHDADWLFDSKQLVVAEGRAGVTLRAADSGELITRVARHPGAVIAVAASSREGTFASVCEAEVLRIWDHRTFQSLLQFSKMKIDSHRSLQFSPDGTELALAQAYSSGGLAIFNAAPRKPRPVPDWTWPLEMRDLKVEQQLAADDNLEALVWLEAEYTYLSGNAAGTLQYFNSKKEWAPCEHPSPLSRLLLRKTNQQILAIHEDGHAQWRSPEGPVGGPFQLPAQLAAVALNDTGRLLALADSAKLCIVEADSGAEQWRFEHPGPVTSIKSVAGRQLVTACTDGVLRTFDILQGDLLASTEALGQSIDTIERSTDGRFVALLTADGFARVLRTSDLQETLRVPRPVDAKSVHFVDGGRWLMFGPGRHPLVATSDGSPGVPLPIPASADALSVSPDGNLIAIKSTSGGSTLITIKDN